MYVYPLQFYGFIRLDEYILWFSYSDLKQFKRYNISVYPIYQLQSIYYTGMPVTKQAYAQQGGMYDVFLWSYEFDM